MMFTYSPEFPFLPIISDLSINLTFEIHRRGDFKVIPEFLMLMRTDDFSSKELSSSESASITAEKLKLDFLFNISLFSETRDLNYTLLNRS